MATLGSVFHDFPCLAKQSGFYFQLHTGRVNWSEIENLNINEIIEKRNFRLLEQNLINVINCNLEREYDIKILDQNFVKLFKLAQLGIDYLSYCEMYLDRCVVLLQEQLTTFQEDYESLKQNNEKKKEELGKDKRRNKKNYQCEKCEKVFISDVYLKFHDKRRHSNPNTPNHLDASQKKLIDNSQQTEDERKLSTSTQTLSLNEVETVPQECEDGSSIKMEHTMKIEKLEQELNNLKERLKKAESSLAEKTEGPQSSQTNVFHPLNVPGSMCYNSMLMLLPSYIKPPDSAHYEMNPERPVPEVYQHATTALSPHIISQVTEVKTQSSNKSQLNTKLEKACDKEKELSEQENKFCVCTDRTDSVEEQQSEGKEALDCNKENIDPNLKRNCEEISVTKPLPPKRKLKKGIIRTQSIPADKMMVEAITKEDTHQEEETQGFSSCSIVHRSTPIKEKPHTEIDWEVLEGSRGNISEIDKPGSNSTESLNSRKSVDHESKSLIKKIVARNSPKLRNFSKSLKTSLTNLYDSVSSTGKDSTKPESSEQNIRAALVGGVNSRLRELGVDPEWRGIPKKTMKQKLNFLKHRRKLLSKDNPMFPVIRQNIEQKIFQKLKNNLGRKKTLNSELNEQESVNDQVSSEKNIWLENKSDFVKVNTGFMYDTDSDSESKASDSERNFSQPPDQGTSQNGVVFEELTSSAEEGKVEEKKSKEFDFSVFQVGGGTLNSLTEDPRQKRAADIKKDELSADSDTEDSSPEHSDAKIFKTFKGYLSSKKRDENSEADKNYDDLETQLEFADPGKSKSENHSILKNNEGLHSMNAKKRVLFASYSDGIEELSDSPMDDDLWPFKSDSEKDVS